MSCAQLKVPMISGGNMYKKGPAIIINCIFGICLAYDVLLLEISLVIKGGMSGTDIVNILLFNITWSLLCLAYNMNRFEKTSNRKTYWITLLAPILAWSIGLEIFCWIGRFIDSFQ